MRCKTRTYLAFGEGTDRNRGTRLHERRAEEVLGVASESKHLHRGGYGTCRLSPAVMADNKQRFRGVKERKACSLTS